MSDYTKEIHNDIDETVTMKKYGYDSWAAHMSGLYRKLRELEEARKGMKTKAEIMEAMCHTTDYFVSINEHWEALGKSLPVESQRRVVYYAEVLRWVISTDDTMAGKLFEALAELQKLIEEISD